MDNLLTKKVNHYAGDAYKCGRNSRLEGLRRNTNPFPANSAGYRAWLCGWYGADSELLS